MEYKRTSIQRLLNQAAEESFSFRHSVIDTEHVLLAMMKTGGIETEALTKSGANYNTLRKIVASNVEEGEATSPATELTLGVRRLLNQARQIAQQTGVREVTADHVLFAILNDRQCMASVMLTVTEVDKRAIYQNLVAGLQESRRAEDHSNLARYGRNINEEARKGLIDPVVGRDNEINRVIQILSRRTKNNPVLIGEPGVGKTAIAEGLAQRIVYGDVPDIMRDKVIYALDMGTMVAGTKYRGDFEQRISDTLDELMAKEDAIVFIDELHTIIGAGSSEGSLDASNILKPALAKGKLQLIGATTIEEYRKHIEKDAALERRFQPVMVEEASQEETRQIIEGLRPRYEDFHKVRITDEAIRAAADLTDRYLPDRFLPDKAVDVIDEAMARVHVKAFRIPQAQKDLETRRKELEEAKTQAALTQNFEEAARLRDQLLALEGDSHEDLEEGSENRADWPAIDGEDVASVVSQWAHVPVTRLTEKESDKYLYLADHLKEKVIGQDYAVDTVSASLKRARVGLKSARRPIGSFIFVGPTGVGKTYLAKQIANQLFGSEDSLIRIDMSEYMEKYSVSRLVGSAPGYVGYEEGGQLTEAVRSHPYSVILFDEIEKAHPDVFNLLLQVLDDGRLTDSQGRTVDFKNTVIIMTSNVGANRLTQSQRIGFDTEETVEENDYERMKEIVHEELKQTFRPEFLNRVDDIVVFHHLSEQTNLKITRLLLDELMERISGLGYQMTYTDAVAQQLASKAYQPEFGARPLEREIRVSLEDLLAEKMLNGDLQTDRQYEICVRKGEIVVNDAGQADRLVYPTGAAVSASREGMVAEWSPAYQTADLPAQADPASLAPGQETPGHGGPGHGPEGLGSSKGEEDA